MYLENHILKEEKIESSKKKISRHPRDIPKGISKEENQRPESVTLYTFRPKVKAEVRLVKLIRAQGGCLGTKSR